MFSGQGVEKANDDCKMILHRKTNLHDGPAQVLKVRYRKSKLHGCQRIKRTYANANQVFRSFGKRKLFKTIKG